ncbi:MAG TPA: MFS transporter [Actinomycetota bacterium]|nr:MFS transporter [Actinomycetota bacterium]
MAQTLDEAAASPRPSYRALLGQNKNFRRVWFATLISLGGDWFNTVALLGLVLDLTGSGFQAALVLAAQMLPQSIFFPIAGPVADRFNRKMIMVTADLVRVLLALGMLLVRSESTVWIGIACVAGIASMEAFYQPASGAALPNLVEPEDLPAANVVAGATWGTMLAVGAALGGIVATTLGRDAAFIINACSFAVSAMLVLSVRANFSAAGLKRTDRHRPIKDLVEGFAFARSHGKIMALLATKGGFGMGVGVIAMLAPFARSRFGAADVGIGLLFAARGIGVILGPPIAARFATQSTSRLFLTIAGSMALYGLGYSMLPFMPGLLLAGLVVVIAHLGGGTQWVMSSYGLQRFTPDNIRGRILSLDLALVSLTVALSSLAAGKLTELIDPGKAISVFAGVAVIYAVAWFLGTRRVVTRPDPS